MTLKELQNNKQLAIYIETKEQWQKLKDLKINICCFYGPCYYSNHSTFWGRSLKNLFNKEDFPEYTVINFEDIEFDLPEKWCVKGYEGVGEWFTKNAGNGYYNSFIESYYHFPKFDNCVTSDNICKGYTEISENEFLKHVKQDKMEKIISYKLLKDVSGINWKKGDVIKESSSKNNWCNNGVGYDKEFVNIENKELFQPVYEEEYKVGDYVTCINSRDNSYEGAGWEKDLCFKINSIDIVYDDNNVLWGGKEDAGVYSKSVRKATKKEIEQSENITINDYTAKVKDGKMFFGSCTHFTKIQLEAYLYLLEINSTAQIVVHDVKITKEILQKLISKF